MNNTPLSNTELYRAKMCNIALYERFEKACALWKKCREDTLQCHQGCYQRQVCTPPVRMDTHPPKVIPPVFFEDHKRTYFFDQSTKSVRVPWETMRQSYMRDFSVYARKVGPICDELYNEHERTWRFWLHSQWEDDNEKRVHNAHWDPQQGDEAHLLPSTQRTDGMDSRGMYLF